MIKLAEHILATKTGKFDPSEFKDEYETTLKALVKRKAAGTATTGRDAPGKQAVPLSSSLP